MLGGGSKWGLKQALCYETRYSPPTYRLFNLLVPTRNCIWHRSTIFKLSLQQGNECVFYLSDFSSGAINETKCLPDSKAEEFHMFVEPIGSSRIGQERSWPLLEIWTTYFNNPVPDNKLHLLLHISLTNEQENQKQHRAGESYPLPYV